MKKFFPLLLCSLLLPNFLASQIPVQTLRGTVTGTTTARPLAGATVLLLGADPETGTMTNESGNFRFEKIPVGRYRMQISYVGYGTLTLAEVLVEAGRETVQDVQLQEQGAYLQEVVVKAQGQGGSPIHPLSIYTVTVEEQLRFPATFFDPARLVTAYPGVVCNNDGTNVISVRGNSPGAVKWWLEGIEIVNPNHTANAGTFGDRPTQAGGGVNILSAQLLGTSNFMAGAFPAEYGNSLGGIFDMRLRRGNDQKHEFTAQAGFIGIDLAAEGPLAQRKPENEHSTPSYLANYRYSFTGLLTAMGADFGDEATAFQDLSFHISFPSVKSGQFSVFGLGGKSSTAFKAPSDSTEIEMEKQRFDIDFQSKMGALGLTHLLPLGKKSVLRSAAVVSALEHRRMADLAFSPPDSARAETDDFSERKMAFSTVFSSPINPRHLVQAGMQTSLESTDFQSDYRFRTGRFSLAGEVKGWLLQPFFDWEMRLSPKLAFSAGLHFSHFTYQPRRSSVEPRLALGFSPKKGTRLSLAYRLNSQTQQAQLYTSPQLPENGLGFLRSHHLVAGYRQDLSKSLVFNMEAYFQHLFDVPVLEGESHTFSALNLTDFSLNYLAGVYGPVQNLLTNDGKGRNYGLDLSLQKFIVDHTYFLLSGSLYSSQYATGDGIWRSTRFDGRHTLNLTAGREFLKTKNGKSITKGLNARIAWLGGFRDTPINEAASADLGFTVYQEALAFSMKQEDYFRIDLRLFVKWNKPGRSSTLSLDIQNITGRKNPQYDYFDPVQGKVLTKRQLGMIPIFNWRVAF